MRTLSGFVVSILLLAFFTPYSTQAQQKDCRKVDVTVDIADSKNGQGGTIKVSTKDSEASFTLHLLTMQRANQQTQITSGTINSIPPGEYELVIQYRDPKYCSETRKVTVN